MLMLAAAPSASAARHDHDHDAHAKALRVAVADGASGRLDVFAVHAGRRLERFALDEAPYSLTAAPDGRHVLVVEQGARRVSAFDGGAWVEEHGDHEHVHVRAPRRLAFSLGATKPAHVVAHGDEAALFDDGTGAITIFGLGDWRTRRTIATPAAHHGVAVPWGDRTLATIPSSVAGELPIGVALVDATGAELQRFEGCPDLHGEYSDAAGVAFGCADGVLLLEPQGDGLQARKVANPAGGAPADHATTLQGHDGAGHLVASFGKQALMLVDRRAGSATRLAFDAQVEDFAVDPQSGDGYALTTDGLVHRFDPASGRWLRSRRAVAAFAPPEDWKQPRPELAVGGGVALVADPANGRVVRLRARSLERDGALRTGGRPFLLAITGAG